MERNKFSAALRSKKTKVSLILLLLITLTVAFTLMLMHYLTNTRQNTFTIGTAEVEIVEPGVDPGEVEWGAESKPVYLENPGDGTSVPGVVRAMLVPVLKDSETENPVGGELGAMSEPVGDKMVLGEITLHFASNWEDNWFYRDGYFYYRKVLNPGERTAQLLSGVTLTDGSLSEVYGDADVTIEVLANILQAGSNAPETEWNVSVSDDGAVTPNS